MATLGKIRKQSVLLLIVIGVALLAFIIGDFFNSSRNIFGPGSSVANVGSESVDIQEFQRRVDQFNQQMQQSNSKEDPAVIQNYVLNSMISETVINKMLDDLGIVVTDDELTEKMIGSNPDPSMIKLAQQMGLQNPKQLHDLIFNPQTNAVDPAQIEQLKAMWLEQEKALTEQLRQQKLNYLLADLVVANNVDAKQLYDEGVTTRHLSFVKQDLNSIPDDQVEITDADIKAEWEKNKQLFFNEEEYSDISYIARDIVPSEADLNAAEKVAEKALADLRTSEGVEALNNNFNFDVKRQQLPAESVTDPQTKQFITTAAVGAAEQTAFNANTYTIVKLIGTTVETDSVNATTLAFSGKAAVLDSITALLNAGKPLADVAKAEGVQASQDSTWFSFIRDKQTPAEVKKLITSAAPGRFFRTDTVSPNAEGVISTTLVRVNQKKAPKTVYDFAECIYRVEPSDKTVNDLRNDLQKFLAVNTRAENLTTEAAAKAGYMLQTGTVSPSSVQVGEVPYSREAVKWVMDNKKGDVSPIFENEGNEVMLVVAINDKVKEGYVPYTNQAVKEAIKKTLLPQKKADKLIADYKAKGAKTIEDYARLMNTAIDDTTATVSFGQPFVPGIGLGVSKLIAEASVAKIGELNGPTATSNAVVVYKVIREEKVDANARPFDAKEYAAIYQNTLFGQVTRNLMSILLKENKVKNNLLKFYTK